MFYRFRLFINRREQKGQMNGKEKNEQRNSHGSFGSLEITNLPLYNYIHLLYTLLIPGRDGGEKEAIFVNNLFASSLPYCCQRLFAQELKGNDSNGEKGENRYFIHVFGVGNLVVKLTINTIIVDEHYSGGKCFHGQRAVIIR